jgi:hypothetical protein
MPTNNIVPRVGSQSPWGQIDNILAIATGILFVGTPGHGGIWLSDVRIAQIPEALRKPAKSYAGAPRWWEEDCEAGFPLWFFGAQFHREWHRRVARDALVKMLDYFGPAWIKALKELHVKPVCARCRSEEVTCDAVATWSDEAQDWELEGTHDGTDCLKCDDECHVFFVPTVSPRAEVDEEEEHIPSEARLRLMEGGL